VFGKVTVAAEQALWNVLPAMLAGQTPKLPNDLSKGSYFGGRKPEDGRIDWSQPAQAVYNLHRAVALPYPGAWTVIEGKTFIIGKARLHHEPIVNLPQGLAVVDNCIFGVCGNGRALRIHELLSDGKPVAPADLQQFLSSRA
jgi:methionyl-tRNA formyltransferase